MTQAATDVDLTGPWWMFPLVAGIALGTVSGWFYAIVYETSYWALPFGVIAFPLGMIVPCIIVAYRQDYRNRRGVPR